MESRLPKLTPDRRVGVSVNAQFSVSVSVPIHPRGTSIGCSGGQIFSFAKEDVDLYQSSSQSAALPVLSPIMRGQIAEVPALDQVDLNAVLSDNACKQRIDRVDQRINEEDECPFQGFQPLQLGMACIKAEGAPFLASLHHRGVSSAAGDATVQGP